MELPKEYDFKASEKKWRSFWEKERIYAFDPASKKPVFSCDTPPPTVSGKMHMGHALAYSVADFVMRFKRMRGHNIFYPFGFDDNGLATERFVEKKLGIKGSKMPRPDFIKLCLKETTEVEKELKENWAALGISPDWSLDYRTIDEWCIKTSQRSFLELYKKGRIYRKESPIVICPQCQTAIAQVEMKDKVLDSFLNYIEAELEDGSKIQFATTRPEVIYGCVGLSVNPEDERYKHLIGGKAKIPLIGRWVPIVGDAETKPEYGTGAVYYCTYGGWDCVEWIAKHPELEPIPIMGTSGRYNENAGKYAGMTSPEARKSVLADLKALGALKKQEPLKHAVNVHERCETEVEYVVTEQWFVKYLDLKERFLAEGAKLNWRPAHMKTRYDNWVKGLKWDWCISRQRFFGVPFPVWYCGKCNEIVVAEEKQLPVDPTTAKPAKGKCGKCGSTEFAPERDVMDTWATSSLTPQIALKWREDDKFFRKMFPMSLRSNGHDIITFWLFNTVVKALLHEGKLPWKDVMINGFVLDPHGKKMSKSKGNIVEPLEVLGKYGADALRFWAAGAQLGSDLPYQEKDLVTGGKFVTKLWNAARFALGHLEGFSGKKPAKLEPIDKWVGSKLNRVVAAAGEDFEQYEYFRTKHGTETFFWHVFCDNYLEIVKDRLYNPDKYSVEAVQSAKYTLEWCLLTTLKLLAPIMPFVSEEIYQHAFRGREGAKSVHVAAWPEPAKEFEDAEAEKAGDLAVSVIAAVRQWKNANNLSLGKEVGKVIVSAGTGEESLLKKVARDIQAACRAREIVFGEGGSVKVNEAVSIAVEPLAAAG